MFREFSSIWEIQVTRCDMPIKEINLEEMPQLGAPISFRCDERVNIFIGPNASGKTSILQAVFAAPFRQFMDSHQVRGDIDPDGDVEAQNQEGGRDVQMTRIAANRYHWRETTVVLSSPVSSKGDSLLLEGDYLVPRYYIPATRVSLHRDANLLPSLTLPPDPLLWYDRHKSASLYHLVTDAIQGITTFQEFQRTVTRLTLSYSIFKLFDTRQGVFYGRDLEVAIDWLKRLSTSDEPLRAQYEKALQLGYSCVKDICRDVIEDEAPYEITVTAAPEPVNDEPEDFDSGEAHLREEDQQPQTRPAIGIGTSDNPTDEPLYLGYLSSGTQGTLLWVWSLAFRMMVDHDCREGWESEPAILLVDEIENHLHPTWQRRVIPALLRHFPGVQIFATTHSPFVVAGLEEGQVHKLYRDKEKIVRAETNDYDIIAWTADEILHEFMGVTDPTDQDTAGLVEILRWLERCGPLDEDESAEEWRLSEVERLESLVQSKEAVSEEIIVLLWLKGGVSHAPAHVELPLQGRAEHWRLEAVQEFRKDIGIELMSGGPIGWRRGILEQIMKQQADGFLGENPSDSLGSNEANTEE